MLNSLKDLDDFIDKNNVRLTTIVYEGINNRKNIIDNINGILLPKNSLTDNYANINNLLKNKVREYKLNKILDKYSINTKDLSSNPRKFIIEYEKKRYSFDYRRISLNSEYSLVFIVYALNTYSDNYSSKILPKGLLYESELVVSSLGNGDIKVIKNRYG